MGPSNTGWGRRRYARAIDEEPAAARIRVRDSVRTVGPTPRLGARSEPLRGAAFPAEKSSPRHGESWYPFEMTPKLTDEMRTALSRQADRPVTVEDDQTHLQYVLLPLEIYERLRAIFDDSTFDEAICNARPRLRAVKIFEANCPRKPGRLTVFHFHPE